MTARRVGTHQLDDLKNPPLAVCLGKQHILHVVPSGNAQWLGRKGPDLARERERERERESGGWRGEESLMSQLTNAQQC
jgi:hypothetical protein